MNTNPPDTCPECGKPLPAATPHGICPACLMAQALASRTIDGPPVAPPPLLLPEEIADKFPQFEILECLGRGGMGVVYKARQKSLNRLVAIKILAPERVTDPQFAERFAHEAELLARLSHPHIVTVHDFGETGGLFYLVMEFINGVNLRDLLREGKLEAEQALAIVPPICEALQFAHERGIVHRDIKPENLLLDRDGRVKIADFGIATLAGDAADRSGTPAYMAPEQAGHAVKIDHRADIYALGVVLYEMLTGERPASSPVAPSRRVQIDVRLDEVVLRALEQEPERRFQTAADFRTVVETVMDRTSPVRTVAPAPVAYSLQQGIDYRSQRSFMGFPLLHVASGLDPLTGKRRIAKGWLAIGDTAIGGIAFGGMAMGGIAFGGLSLGIIGYGGLAIGLMALGGGALGALAAVGGLAIGGTAVGGMAVGWYAHGGGAFGGHVLSPLRQDPEAIRFFTPWAQKMLSTIGIWNTAAILLGITVSAGVPALLIHRGLGDRRSPLPPAPSPAKGTEEFPKKDFTLGKLVLHFAPAILLILAWLTSGLEKGAVLILSMVILASLILRSLSSGNSPGRKWLIALALFLCAAAAIPLFLSPRDGGFGKVIERDIPEYAPDTACVLDFETGKLLPPDPHGMDAQGEGDALMRRGRLYLLKGELYPGTDPSRELGSWKKKEILPLLAPGPRTNSGDKLSEENGWPIMTPLTCAFSTGDGSAGALRASPVIKADGTRSAIKVRYKLLKP